MFVFCETRSRFANWSFYIEFDFIFLELDILCIHKLIIKQNLQIEVLCWHGYGLTFTILVTDSHSHFVQSIRNTQRNIMKETKNNHNVPGSTFRLQFSAQNWTQHTSKPFSLCSNIFSFKNCQFHTHFVQYLPCSLWPTYHVPLITNW